MSAVVGPRPDSARAASTRVDDITPGMREAKRTPPRPIPGCYSVPCPKCSVPSPCVDHSEVDIGVGMQTWDHEHYCSEHGAFAFADGEEKDARTGLPVRHAVFRDEEEPK